MIYLKHLLLSFLMGAIKMAHWRLECSWHTYLLSLEYQSIKI